MTKKPTYEELEQRVKDLEKVSVEREKAREAPQKSEGRFKFISNEFEAILDHLPALIFYKDTKGNYIRVNKYVADAHHISKKQLEGKSTFELYPKEQAEAYLNDDLEVIKSGKPKLFIEEPWETEKGNKWLSTSKIPFLDENGDIVGIIGISMDITDRKQAEEALRESEQKYKTLTDSSLTGIIIHQDDRFVYVNDKFAEMLGYDPEELLWKKHYDVIHPDYREMIKQRGHKRLRGEKVPNQYEIKKVRKDGKPVWHEVIIGDAITYRGKPAIMGHEIAITDRKQAEAALREAYNIINRSPAVAFLWKNAEGWPVEFVSENVEKLYGYTAKEFTSGKVSYASVVYPDDLDRIAKEVADYSEDGGKKSFINKPYRITTKNGEVKYLEDRTFIRRDKEGRITHYEGIVIDITERHSMEEKLRESEKKYRSVVENSIQGFIIIQDSIVRFANQSAAEMFGYTSPDELVGLNNWETLIAPEYQKELQDRTADIIDGKSISIHPGWQGIRKDGKIIWLQSTASQILWQDRPAVLGYLSNITEYKKAEEEKQKLEAQLQRAQKMEAIGNLAGGVAHDLNNVLAGLVSYPDLILMDLPENSHLRKPIRTMRKSGQKAAAIVQDLLTLARRGFAVTEVVNLNHIISEYLESPEYENLKSFHTEVHVKTDLETDLLHILGSPVHLSKTVMNLVSNAAEAMPGGGTISISTENRYIDRPIRGYDHIKDGDYVIFTITDTGVGISSDDMKRIFEPFYTKKAMGRSGTGLGMAVVWGTVKDHKGYIDIQSTERKGTTFTLYFPVTRKEIAKDESPVSIEDYMGRGESILVVDDVEEQREIASQILKKLGYSVALVSSGEEAVDYLKNNSADLLVLDMIMEPGIDGLEAYKRICEMRPGQKTIIASGFAETDRVKEAKRLGAGAYIKKPFLLEKIGLAVKEELNK